MTEPFPAPRTFSVPAPCPVCGGTLDSGAQDLLLGELLDCLECASELEVTALDPLVLTEAPMAAEDWGE